MVATHTTRSAYLIDASVYIFRSYFALPDEWINSAGYSVNAVYGYTRFLLNLLKKTKPLLIAAAFDESLETGFRHYLYADYKSNRVLADDALSYQLTQCQRITKLLGIRCYASPVFEADDLLATLVRLVESRGQQAVILSHDKDLAQLVQNGHQLWDIARERLLSEQDIMRVYGVRSAQIPDYLALIGDVSDCIPGVDGIGPKTASQLLAEFSGVVELAAHVGVLKQRSFRGRDELCDVLENNLYSVMLSKELATLWNTATEVNRRDTLDWVKPNAKQVNTFFEEMGFGRAITTQFNELMEIW